MSVLTGESNVLFYSACVNTCVDLLPAPRFSDARPSTRCSAFSYDCWCQYSLAGELVNKFSNCFTYSCLSAAQSQFVSEVSETCQAWNTDIGSVFNPSNPLRTFLPSPTSTTATPSLTISTLQSTSLFVSTTLLTFSGSPTPSTVNADGHLTPREKGTIAGSVIGGLLGIAIAAVLFIVWRRRGYLPSYTAEYVGDRDPGAGPTMSSPYLDPPQEFYPPAKEQRASELMSSGIHELADPDSAQRQVATTKPIVVEGQELDPISASAGAGSDSAGAEVAEDVIELERLEAEEERIRERRSVLLERLGRQSKDVSESSYIQT